MGKSVIIGEHIFATQKSAEIFIRTFLNEIGVCSSVKSISLEKYNVLCHLCKRHPDSLNKMNGIIDFVIVKNKLNSKALELNILRTDGSIIDISWKICIRGTPNTYNHDIYMAFRVCVEDQITHFRSTNDTSKCSICNSYNIKTHIDHVVHFQKLVEEFLQTYNGKLPSKFDTINDNSNRCCFMDIDNQLSKAFYYYHKENASLRVLCENCNLRREKYKVK